jgi:hypothetical protein
MTGSSKRSTLTYPVATADKATELPTAQYVEDAITALAATGAKLPSPMTFGKRTASQSIGQDGRVTVVWNPRTINVGAALDANGILTIPENGNYLFWVALQATITGNYQSSQGQVQIRYRAILRDITNALDFGDFFNYTYGATQAAFTNKQSGLRLELGLVAGQQLRVDATTQAIGATSVISSSQVDGSTENNNLIVWKVS